MRTIQKGPLPNHFTLPDQDTPLRNANQPSPPDQCWKIDLGAVPETGWVALSNLKFTKPEKVLMAKGRDRNRLFRQDGNQSPREIIQKAGPRA